MKLLSLILLSGLLYGCDALSGIDEVDVIAVEEMSSCKSGKATILQTATYGRIKRCGVWGKIGERFRISLYAQGE